MTGSARPMTAAIVATAVTLAVCRTAVAATGDEQVQVTASPVFKPAVTAVRVTGMLDVFNGGAYGIEVSRRMTPALGIDVAFGANDMDYGHHGVFAELLGRAYLFNGIGGVSLALGPSLRTADRFGAVGFVRAELAVELRALGVPNLLLGLGPEVALNDSGQGVCPDNGWLSCFLWKDHWNAGDLGFRVRVAAGWAF
jgi:hypothetical protein